MGATFILVAFGLSAIYSVALSVEGGSFIFFQKQLLAAAVGLGLIFVLSLSNYRLFRNWTTLIYFLGLSALIGVLFFGTTVRGTTGWFSLFGFSVQPVEFMKLALILTLTKYFGEKARRRPGWREILTSGLYTGVPTVLVLLQPDFGSAAILALIWLVYLFFSGLRFWQAAVLAVAAAAVGLLSWFFLFVEYQRERILIFLDPSRDPLGRGYNVLQAIIAIGSGQLFGRGLGFGSQSQLKFLPESQTDFVFAVIAEELGFIGVLLVLGAFCLLFSRLFRLIKGSHDNYTTYLLLGSGAVLFIQFFVNIAMNLGLLPVAGITLPFMSYGGSSLLTMMALVGLLQSVAVRMGSAVR